MSIAHGARKISEIGDFGFVWRNAGRPGPLLRADQAAKAGLIIRDMNQSRETVMRRLLMRFSREREGARRKLRRLLLGAETRQFGPPPGRHSIGFLEMPGQVRLVGKTGLGGDIGQRQADGDSFAGGGKTAHDQEPVRRRAEQSAEMPGQREAIQPGQVFELRRGNVFIRMRGKKIVTARLLPPVENRRAYL
jgi:hypothetical protein